MTVKQIMTAALLAAVLCAGALAGCADRRDSESAAPAPESAQEAPGSEPTEPETATPEEPLPGGDETAVQLFDLPAIFESNPGDELYFHPVDEGDDDYMVVMYSAHLEPSVYGDYVDGMGAVTAYDAYIFQKDDAGNDVLKVNRHKLVFENEQFARDAAAFHPDQDGLYVVGNVIYLDEYAIGAALGAGKDEIVQGVYSRVVGELGGSAFLSKPEGYEELMQ